MTPAELADKIRGDGDAATLVRATLSTLQPGGQRTTARRWFGEHHGARVHTVQHQARSTWAPLDREVDASRATAVRLDGSAREYAGLRVVYSSDTVLWVSYDFGGPSWAVYVVAPA